jgi:hypothetical protein
VNQNISVNAKVPGYCTSSTNCVTTLGYKGLFKGCDSGRSNYLFFEAFCEDDTHVLLHSQYESGLANQDVSTERLIFGAYLLDGLSVIIFFLGILWIQREQAYESKEFESLTCRADDYTVECLTIPPHEDERDLKIQLRAHFETVLSKQKPVLYNEEIKIAGTYCFTSVRLCIVSSYITDSY